MQFSTFLGLPWFLSVMFHYQRNRQLTPRPSSSKKVLSEEITWQSKHWKLSFLNVCTYFPNFGSTINITNNTYLLILISSLKLLLLFRLVLEEEGINQKKENMMTTKNNHTFWRNHHYNGRCNHLGGPASFIKRAKLNYIFRLRNFTKNQRLQNKT